MVVCPDCGTPMHRKCFQCEGKCPNENLHSTGYVFEEFDKIKNSAKGSSTDKDQSKADDNGDITCRLCGEKNKNSATYCNRCGTVLSHSSNTSEPNLNPMAVTLDPLAGVPADTKFEDDVTAGDIACYVKINTPYYVNAFARIKKNSNRFNFSAAIFSGVWFLFRKQYKVGGIICAINILLYSLFYYLTYTFTYPLLKGIFETIGISADTINMTTEQYGKFQEYLNTLSVDQWLILLIPFFTSVLFLVMAILTGIFGNKLYYKHCISKIKVIKSEVTEHKLPASSIPLALNTAGGVNMLVALVFFVMYLLSVFYL